MSDVIIPYRFLWRGGTAAAVAALNEVVKYREAEAEFDTGRFKFGDGVTAYSSLLYANEGLKDLTGLSNGQAMVWDSALGHWKVDGPFVTAAYVDAAIAGLSWKQAVRVATTANGTLASAFENGDTVDGVTLATGDRILVKNQSTASQNGIYVVAASGAPTRSTDADSGAELVNASVYVSEGTANADTQWTCTTNGPIAVGSTSLAFAQLTSGGGIIDGDKGDITVSASGATWTIDAAAITLAKMADVATATVFYRKTAGTGAPEVQALATLKTDLGLTGTNTGDQNLSPYAPLASPALTETPTAPTATPGTNTTQLATMAAVQTAVANGPTGAGAWTLIRKTADEARTTTTTVANDAELTTSLAAGTRYRIKIFIAANAGGNAPGFKFTIAYSGTTTLVEGRRSQSFSAGSTATTLETSLFSGFYSTVTGGTSYLEWDYIITTNTAGTLTFQWAQNTSSGQAVTIRAGSFFEFFVC